MHVKKSVLIAICIAHIVCAEEVTAPEAAPAPVKKINFNYDNEELVNIINYISSLKDVNVILPMQEDQKIKAKLTWHLDKKITVNEAWDLLNTILDIAGYSIIPKAHYYEIVKNNKEISREPVPLFIGTDAADLPATDERIRYIYYFSNVRMQPGEGRENEINTVLKTLLPENASFRIDIASNAMLIIAPSNDIRSIMSLIAQLDRPGFQEKLEILPLHYASARIVADLFNKKIFQNEEKNQYNVGPKKPTEAQYFSKHLRLIANDRSNSLIMIGRSQAIERIKDFVNKYIDVKQDSGDAILHVYQLQYLDAASFAEVLNNIVKSKNTQGTGQSTATPQKVQGPERFFEDVIISVDTPKRDEFESVNYGPENTNDEKKLTPSKYYGGNNLIIAARADDWKRIKKLIEDLDQPRPQVLIEVLIADLTVNDTRALGNMFRNPAKLPMPDNFNIQSAQLSPGVVPDSFNDPKTIGVIQNDAGTVQDAADIARLFTVNQNGQRVDASAGTDGATSVINGLTPGATAITLNDADGKTWSIAQILKVLDNTKVLSHPHVISTDNQEAVIENTEVRLLAGDSKTGTGGAIVQKQDAVPASLKVKFRPRITPTQNNKAGTVNLDIRIDIDQFRSQTDNTRLTRNVTTTATINSGDVLAIGGLIRTDESNGVNETPILSKIPIIGWLFKNQTKENNRTNLTVFISPTIIEPRLRGGVGQYTKDYVDLQLAITQEGNLFGGLKDPITRWFFKTEKPPTERLAAEFLSHDEKYATAKTPMPENQLRKKTSKSRSELPVAARNATHPAENLKNLLQAMDNPFVTS